MANRNRKLEKIINKLELSRKDKNQLISFLSTTPSEENVSNTIETVQNITQNAPEEMNTFKEVYDAIQSIEVTKPSESEESEIDKII